MELLQGFMQPPKAQSVDETIPTLCDRVENATLIGDRRSAILGLKSFSREYRETVVALGLKPLLNTLKRDFVDEASVKAILETLLILFIRGDGTNDLTRSWISQQSRLQSGKYPSPLVMKQEMETVDQFSLWIADAITQSEEMVHLLIQLLETGNFHVRLYTIQILEALVATRPSRARTSITSLPTGVSTLVSLLDDAHEAVRDEIILLLMAVVNNSSHVQGLVAFENIFERLFSIIDEEGGLRGSIVVNDCLSLIHNILRYNTSNQTLFLETGNLPKLAHILNEPLQEESFFWNEQRIININTALDIVTLTVEPGTTKTEKHQNVLLESNVLMIVLRLVFFPNIPKKVRPVAVLAAADMVRGNKVSQREFSKIDVPYFDASLPADLIKADESDLVPVVDLLINWALYANSIHAFPTRVSAVELLKSYLKGNQEQQYKFIQEQITYYEKNGNADEIANRHSHFKCNLFEALFDYDPDLKLNPYKLYFTTDLFMYLFELDNEGNESLREMTRHMSTGNDLDGEEQLCSIQTLSELLITSLSSDDVRIPISYITILVFWLYGDQNAVNDFLSSKATIQSLLSFSYQIESEHDMTVKCLVTILLGVSYEFSSKDSPFPRKDYLEFITKTLGKDNYLSRIKQFKAESLFCKADAQANILDPSFDESGLPEVYFSSTFVSFFLDNYYRIKAALTHSPDEEPCSKITFEIFEEVQTRCLSLKEELKVLRLTSQKSSDSVEEQLSSLNEKYDSVLQEYESFKTKHSSLENQFQAATKELDNSKALIKTITEERNRLYESKEASFKDCEEKSDELTKIKLTLETLERELKGMRSEKEKAENGINKMNRELLLLTKDNEELQNRNKQLEKETGKQIYDLQKKGKQLESVLSKKDDSFKTVCAELEQTRELLKETKEQLVAETNEWKAKFQSHDSLVSKLTEKLKSLASSYRDMQTDRDDLQNQLSAISSRNEEQMVKLKGSLDNSMLKTEELASQNKQLNTDLQGLKDTHSQEVNSYSKKLSSVLKEMEILKENIHTLEVQLDAKQVEGVNNDATNRKLEETCAGMEKRIQNYERLIPPLESRCKELEKELQDSQLMSSSLQKEKFLMQSHLDELSNAYKTSVEKIKNLEKELAQNATSHEETVEGLNNTINELHGEASKLNVKWASMEEKMAAAENNVSQRTESELERLRTSKQDIEESCSVKDHEILNLKSESKNLETKVDSILDDLKREQSIKDQLQHQLEILKESKAEVEAEKKALIDENERSQRLLNNKEEQLKESSESFTSDLQKMKEKLNSKTKDMEGEIEHLRSELKNRSLEIEKERNLLKQGSDLVTQGLSDKVGKLEEMLNSEEQKMRKKSKELDVAKSLVEKLKSENKKLSVSSKTNIDNLQSSYENKEKDFLKVTEELQKLRVYEDDKACALQTQISVLNQTINENSEKEKSLKAQIAQNEQLINVSKNDAASLNVQMKLNEAELKTLKEKSSAAEMHIKTLTAEKEELNEKFKKETDKLMDNNGILEWKLQGLMEKIKYYNTAFRERQSFKDHVDIKDQDLTASHALGNGDETPAQADHFGLNNDILEDEVQYMARQLDHWRTVIEEKNVALKVSENLNESLSDVADALKKENASLKEQTQELLNVSENKNSSSEVDDLMLLVTDLDEKNAKYRAMLKQNGVNFSSDDDEEDEEDGEDNGDDDAENEDESEDNSDR
ncbi:hypothetical protein HG535_0B06300 [Zygotorulaspora mrakii]|uniref:Vesicle tethering protein Uso1/P115-like head domain-containing protein n=1 Tax=Zygotorulaspora mrakii TaxID=42260 RepID=A0A7H9AYT9_ZYGMR|nr:uncharacterized protein HG535_0B06300 [Zygotorulaspora mrakii]QLG71585.1 hypothetical protein HG535_0B06300 [Zygotorulaspora mrakii]